MSRPIAVVPGVPLPGLPAAAQAHTGTPTPARQGDSC
jgi:hypothetical protein